MRIAQNLAYVTKEAQSYITPWQPGWARGMYKPTMVTEKLIAKLGVLQRNALRIPRKYRELIDR